MISLKSNYLTQGPIIKKFEKKLSQKLKSKYVLCVSSGSAALHIVAKCLGWKKGDKIISSPITFVSGINSALHCGATPDFVDINESTFNLDPDKLEDKLKKDKKIKAAIITDFAGQPSDWEDLFYLKKKYKINLVNDNCHSLGSKYKKNIGYATKYADVSCLSFHPVKHITTGEGGAILTNNTNLYNKCKLYRSHGMTKIISSTKIKNKPWFYEMRALGFNYRLSDIHASLGLSQLKKLDKFIEFRKQVAKKYNLLFSKISEINTPYVKLDRTHSYHLYVLNINFKKIKKKKKDLFNLFKRNNISLQVHYIPIFLQPYFIKNFNINPKNFPSSMKFYDQAFSVPIFYGLKNQTIFKVCKLLKFFLK